ncbi:MAG: hypothetical protein ABFR02_09960 [Campylobacterota bacterium]
MLNTFKTPVKKNKISALEKMMQKRLKNSKMSAWMVADPVRG